jgi:alanyl-tRNA synthetase
VNADEKKFMTERLYYDDAYLTRFEARVVEQFTYKDRFTVVLDRTTFYPTSGGQPFDRGVLGGVEVVDVLVRETDGAILHLLNAALSDQPEILGEIDWERRFDHMQQHTGQHILSQVFVQIAQAETVGFHLGTKSATIDLAGSRQLSPSDLDEAESLANEIVWEDRPVTSRVVRATELADVPLRKPPAVAGEVRVVQVADFDWSACGGTHVARTGEIGLIKIIKWEKRGDETRVEFRCGRRALNDYRLKNSMVNRLAAGFNVGYWELDQAVERLVTEAKDLRSCLRRAGRALAQYEAAEMRAAAPSVSGVRLVVRNLADRSSDDMRELARQLVSEPGVVALLGLVVSAPRPELRRELIRTLGTKARPNGVGDRKAQFCFARSPDVEIDMVSLVRDTVETLRQRPTCPGGRCQGEQSGELGARRGGGKPDFAQGGGPLADIEQMDTALDWAAHRIRRQL